MLGQVVCALSSPVTDFTDILKASDPVFYLHHANMDRVWWSWQNRNLTSRLTDFTGPLYPMDFTFTRGGNATLDTPLDYVSIAPAVTVKDTMDIRAGGLCYTYDKLY